MSTQFTQEELALFEQSVSIWVKTRSESGALAGLGDENGSLTLENSAAIAQVISDEFGGYFTTDNLDAALEKAKAARKLRFKVETQTKKAANTKTSVTGLLNHAATTEVSGAAAWTAWLKVAPAGLMGADGSIGPENRRLVQEVLDAEFGGRATVRNIGAAVSLLKAQNRLHWTELPLSAEEQAKQLEARDRVAQLVSDSKNLLGQKDPAEIARKMEEAAASAVKQQFEKADRIAQAEIKKIIQTHAADPNAKSPTAIKMEVDAFLKVKQVMDSPPGDFHHDKTFVRQEIGQIIANESHDGVIGFWSRVRHRVEKEVLKEFDRRIR